LIDFPSEGKPKATKYRLWDTWGLERNNYEACEFENIIKGRASNKWKMTDAAMSRIGDIAQLPKSENIQNCVIFFIPMAELDTIDSDLLLKTKDFMKKAVSAKVSCILAITKVDQIVPSFKLNPSLSDKQIITRVDKAAQLFNLAPNRIFPLVNYYANDQKNFEIDRLIFKILSTAAEIADNHAILNPITKKSILDKKYQGLIDG